MSEICQTRFFLLLLLFVLSRMCIYWNFFFASSECEDPFCTESHEPVAYDRVELARQGAYIGYNDFLHFTSVIFDPKFLWRYEEYLSALYDAFGSDRMIAVRHVRTILFYELK